MKKTNEFLKTMPEIEAWLVNMEIKNYTLIEDPTHGFVVNVKKYIIDATLVSNQRRINYVYGASVDLSGKGLKFIPVQFGEVGNNFFCNENALKSLQGSPKSTGKHFDCFDNKLVNLIGASQNVGGSFDCSRNKLTSLQGSPSVIGGYFSCSHNDLENLEFSPKVVSGSFSCENNKIKNLEYCPESIGGDFSCAYNPLLEHVSKINDFEDIYKIHKEFVTIKAEKNSLEKMIENSVNSDFKNSLKI